MQTATALVIALLEGMSDAEALRFACAAGALTATKPGAQPALPTRATIPSGIAGNALPARLS